MQANASLRQCLNNLAVFVRHDTQARACGSHPSSRFNRFRGFGQGTVIGHAAELHEQSPRYKTYSVSSAKPTKVKLLDTGVRACFMHQPKWIEKMETKEPAQPTATIEIDKLCHSAACHLKKSP